MNETEDKALDEEEGKKYALPSKFRASLDAADEAGFALLEKNDEAQKELAQRVNTPFVSHTPKERERANALITIESLENAMQFQGLTSAQREQLAESYASVGRYREATRMTDSEEKSEVYRKINEAVWRDDRDWCDHPDDQKYIKEMIWSVREAREMPLLACNLCSEFNVLDAPVHLLEAQKIRADVRRATKDMDQTQTKRFLENSRRR